jgi:hypothetical protein
MRKEAFGIWKEQFVHHNYTTRQEAEAVKQNREKEARDLENARRHRVHMRARGDLVVKYSIPFYTILYYSILFYTILYYSILFYAILYYSMLFYAILWGKISEA